MNDHVDLDLLADYVAGVLDPSVAAELGQLIRARPDWGRAEAALREADTRVEADLRELGQRPEPLPAPLAARLDRTLAALADAEPPTAPATVERATVVPITSARRRHVAAWAAAAAAVAVLLIGGLAVSGRLLGQQADQAGMPASGVRTRSSSPVALPPFFATGRDYTRQDVTQAGTLTAGPRPHAQALAVPDELRPLQDPANLDACLRAVRGAHGGGVGAVDFARFEGLAALVVVLRDADGPGSRRIVVAGPHCGQSTTGVDERFTVTG